MWSRQPNLFCMKRIVSELQWDEAEESCASIIILGRWAKIKGQPLIGGGGMGDRNQLLIKKINYSPLPYVNNDGSLK